MGEHAMRTNEKQTLDHAVFPVRRFPPTGQGLQVAERPRLSRRRFLTHVAAAVAVTTPSLLAADDQRRKKILLRSSWQTVNIGDIAHTPGMLTLLERHLPEVEVTLWPNRLSPEVESLLKRRFPQLRLAITRQERQQALDECDFCLHGSGPGMVGWRELETWRQTGKPYGFGGVTLSDAELRDRRDLLAGAWFVFCRDTRSLEALRRSGVSGPLMEFGPDATFHLDLQNEKAAEAFLAEHRLEPRRFACFVPRLRFTPYWKDGRKMSPEEIAQKEAVNKQYQEIDHAKVRAAIVAWVRETGHRALLCPEMTYQVPLLRPLLFDPLPDDVKPHVVIRPSYWLTDEAASTYARAAAVVSCEMHSPIIALANRTPAIHLRQPTDTRKGQMWSDVGLEDWLFEIDDATGEQVADCLLELYRDQDATQAKVNNARNYVAQRGVRMAQVVKECLA